MKHLILTLLLMMVVCPLAIGQDSPKSVYESQKLFAPVIPPKEKRIRVIITSDARNEIDDVRAIALAILSPERFEIEGFVGGHYDHSQWRSGTGPESIDKSVQEIRTILEKAGMQDRYPVYRGADPMQYPRSPSRPEGVDFIVERAMASDPENPLWLIGLGAATDIASAYLLEPAIADIDRGRTFQLLYERLRSHAEERR